MLELSVTHVLLETKVFVYSDGPDYFLRACPTVPNPRIVPSYYLLHCVFSPACLMEKGYAFQRERALLGLIHLRGPSTDFPLRLYQTSSISMSYRSRILRVRRYELSGFVHPPRFRSSIRRRRHLPLRFDYPRRLPCSSSLRHDPVHSALASWVWRT